MDTVYTRGLWDTGDTVSATGLCHGDRRGLPLGMEEMGHRIIGVERGPGRDAGT